jgi:peptide deformylase
MSILKVARMGHPVLRQRARPLGVSALRDPLVQKLIDDMIETMHEYHGVGLAAPQVHEDLRIFVGLLDDAPEDDSEPMAVINPEITPLSDEKAEGREGCLSIPEIFGAVPRFVSIGLKGLNRDGKPIDVQLKDYAARVAQHETDHLDGILFLDRMTSMLSLSYASEYSRFHDKDQEDD